METRFVFYGEAGLPVYANFRADGLRSLLKGIETVSGSSIYYHFHHALFRRHFITSDYLNDFARWVWLHLNEPSLAEKLASLDPVDYGTVREAREALWRLIREAVGASESVFRVPEGEEFYFSELRSFVYPVGLEATDLESFGRVLDQVPDGSLLYHFIAAAARLGHPRNDFSLWLEFLGEEELARQFDRVSPYAYNLHQLRARMVELIRARLDHVRDAG
ncbi:MAG: hypothetical protein HY652_05375 [Acidobacteria bacterium]|nr:hypothetical protein [Acidobacteriota bacterium]